MKTIKTPQKCLKNLMSLILTSLVLLSACKKEHISYETKQQKLEKVMLLAGLKPVANKDIPLGIKPIVLSDAQVDSIINGLVPKNNNNMSAFNKSITMLASLHAANNKPNNTIMDDGNGEDVPWGTVNFFGSKQIYFFVNVNLGVSLTFNKTKSQGSYIYKIASNVISATTYESSGSLTYSGVNEPSATWDNGSVNFNGNVNLYYSYGGNSWEGNKKVKASGTYVTAAGANNLTVTIE